MDPEQPLVDDKTLKMAPTVSLSVDIDLTQALGAIGKVINFFVNLVVGEPFQILIFDDKQEEIDLSAQFQSQALVR